MKTFRKTFRMEVSIKAETKEQADAIFEELDLQNLVEEIGKNGLEEVEFVESYETEEIK